MIKISYCEIKKNRRKYSSKRFRTEDDMRKFLDKKNIETYEYNGYFHSKV